MLEQENNKELIKEFMMNMNRRRHKENYDQKMCVYL